MKDVMVVAGARTAIGDYGLSLKDVPATKLGAIAIKEAVSRAKIDPASVGHGAARPKTETPNGSWFPASLWFTRSTTSPPTAERLSSYPAKNL